MKSGGGPTGSALPFIASAILCKTADLGKATSGVVSSPAYVALVAEVIASSRSVSVGHAPLDESVNRSDQPGHGANPGKDGKPGRDDKPGNDARSGKDGGRGKGD